MLDILKKKLGQFLGGISGKPQEPETTTKAVRSPGSGDTSGAFNSAIQKPETSHQPVITVSLQSKVSNLLTGKATVSEGDIDFAALEQSFLESDVPYEVATLLCEHLKRRLVGTEFSRSNLDEAIKSGIVSALLEILEPVKGFDLLERVSSPSTPKPYKIMFIGVNGTGKTTTLAKLAWLLRQNGKSVVFAACDTFRSGAIEQLGMHAEKIGVKMVKGNYGSDPASVAFDAVKHAQAESVDVVLIDTAGRQDTKVNLLEQMAKMERVIKPDLTVFVAEAISANADTQIKSFEEKVKIDALILTKEDCDAKGLIFALAQLGIPIIYIGTGQGYPDLEKFDPKKIVETVL